MTSPTVSPCGTCATLADCSTCRAYDAFLLTLPEPVEPVCIPCQEASFLFLSGELLDQVAPRILNRSGRPFTSRSLEKHLYRHGLGDTIKRMTW